MTSPSGLRQAGARVLQAFIIAIIAVVLGGLAVALHPPLWLLAVGAVQSDYAMCSAPSLYRGAQKRMEWNAARDRIRNESTLLAKDARFEHWKTPFGSYWMPAGNFHEMPAIIGQQHAGYYAWQGRVAKPGDVVIDCGAHIGTFVRRALQDGASLVIAVEPSPGNLEALRRNLKTEIEQKKVILYPKGVWDKEDSLPLFEDPQHTAASGFLYPGAKHKQTGAIPLTTIDLLVKELNLTKVDVIKMDIKGATEKALHGAKGTIGRDHPWIELATEEKVDDPRVLHSTVLSLAGNYTLECSDASLVSAVSARPNVLFYH